MSSSRLILLSISIRDAPTEENKLEEKEAQIYDLVDEGPAYYEVVGKDKGTTECLSTAGAPKEEFALEECPAYCPVSSEGKKTTVEADVQKVYETIAKCNVELQTKVNVYSNL